MSKLHLSVFAAVSLAAMVAYGGVAGGGGQTQTASKSIGYLGMVETLPTATAAGTWEGRFSLTGAEPP